MKHSLEGIVRSVVETQPCQQTHLHAKNLPVELCSCGSVSNLEYKVQRSPGSHLSTLQQLRGQSAHSVWRVGVGLATQFQALHTRRAARPLHHSILWRAIQEKMSFALKNIRTYLSFCWHGWWGAIIYTM